ncbi:hypothetical protein [Chelatococcus sp.]|nr:hypothetical protein [Chelatococcus sp.]MBX3545876.1 hypothetical protein [Chelatococcus sp.]MCO5077306.1 hypothetical protein [Chelatococcus sp.]CAH1670521.1 hypothetical protein CHELA41_23404 [Hyphomicrobiales bacterium]CAH1677247.1 hypothetical protein CHELA20_51608 [Hyphomicrobiales bacterium]
MHIEDAYKCLQHGDAPRALSLMTEARKAEWGWTDANTMTLARQIVEETESLLQAGDTDAAQVRLRSYVNPKWRKRADCAAAYVRAMEACGKAVPPRNSPSRMGARP